MTKFFYAKHHSGYRDIGTANLTESKQFTEAIQEFGAEQAMAYFPTQWMWYGENLPNEKVSDMPAIVGSGLALSTRAFEVFRKAFPEEMRTYAKINIDGYEFLWTFPPAAKREEIDAGRCTLNMVVEIGRYKKCFSEDFVNLWNASGLTGCDFTPLY